jgi:transposase
VVADKGYHSGAALLSPRQVGVRSCIPKPERGRRNWQGREAEQAPVYETGGMRRTHLRGRDNILKRLLIQAVGFNLALLARERLPCVQIALFALAAAEWAVEDRSAAAAA